MSAVRLLGQASVRIEVGPVVIYIDPYFTDYVYETEKQEDLRRLVPIPVEPEEVTDANWFLVTHAHMDHCDPTTLAPAMQASPSARIICPRVCRAILEAADIDMSRVVTADEAGHELGPGVRVDVVPAAHPQVVRDADGQLEFLGFVIEHGGVRYYHAGDSSPDPQLIEAVRALGSIDVAFIPVNEKNYYRDERGIIGNMSVREAFQLAVDLDVKKLVPVHWDMFAPNRVYPEEIQVLYAKEAQPFELHMTAEQL